MDVCVVCVVQKGTNGKARTKKYKKIQAAARFFSFPKRPHWVKYALGIAIIFRG
jgi:hypothetical protein